MPPEELKKEEAIAGVGEAFKTTPEGLTPEQQKAVAGVSSAFAKKEPETTTVKTGGMQEGSLVSNQGKPGFDVFGNPIAGYVAPETISRPVYEEEPTLPKTESAQDIQARKIKESQERIDALNKYYAGLVEGQKEENIKKEREGGAISTLTGLAGSTEADVKAQEIREKGQKAIGKIQEEQAVAISSIFADIQESAIEEARLQREEAREDQEYINKRRTEITDKAINNAQLIASGGVTIEGLRDSDPETYNYLSEKVGGEDVLKGIFTLNRPAESIIDKRIEGGKYIIAYQNPIDGSTRIETVDLGIPAGYSKTIDAGNRILAIPDDWSGDPNELITINKGLTPTQQAQQVSAGTETGSIERDAESVMSGSLNLQDISVKDNYRAKVSAELRKKSDEALKSGDIYGVMKASAVYDKEPSDTFLQSMEKVTSVLGQLGVLQENLTNGFDEGKIEGVKTGPIVGAFKSANPWSTEGQVIKAQLNAIVPNLARGVYGEVGVLTDNDIKTYSQTIPNLRSTEDIRNAVLYITVDMIRKNIENKIKNQSAGQRDMSGYADIYRSVVEQSDEILSQISGGREETLTSPDGTQFVNLSDLTEEEIAEAKESGWK